MRRIFESRASQSAGGERRTQSPVERVQIETSAKYRAPRMGKKFTTDFTDGTDGIAEKMSLIRAKSDASKNPFSAAKRQRARRRRAM
jgi:hypothetical protein